MHRWIPFLLLAVLASEVFADTGFQTWVGQSGQVRVGDDPRWADPDFDDSSWESYPFSGLPQKPNLRWFRTQIELPSGLSPAQPLAVVVSALASHELYWDGQLIGRGGKVGATAAEEIPGDLTVIHPIPSELTKSGRHTLALRSSAWHVGFAARTSSYLLAVGELRLFEAVPLRQALPPLLCLGGFVLAGLYFLLLFLLNRDQLPHLLIGLLSLTVAGQLVAEVWRSLFGYTYDLHILRLRLVAGLAWLTGGLLVAFLASRFRARWGGALTALSLGLSALAAFALPGYDLKTQSAFLVALLFALGLALSALRRRAPGAGLATLGVALCLGFLFFTYQAFLDLTLFYSIALLVFFLLWAHALQMRQQRRAHEAALVNSMRLELELVKKHLSPHFLMNTLNTLSGLFEERPEAASSALEALANELRGLQEVASERLIPMGRELDLCRSHLALMGFRRERVFILETEGVEPHHLVPPAIFHTLVENALTHNRYEDPEVRFRLTQEKQGGRRHYIFTSPLGADGLRSSSSPGTGLRYVRARLAESFGDAWELFDAPRDGFWRTEIVLPAER